MTRIEIHAPVTCDNDEMHRWIAFGTMFCSTIAARKQCTSLTEIENMRYDSAGQLIAMNAMNATTSRRQAGRALVDLKRPRQRMS